MNRDTPLKEVAHHLPAEAAEVLGEQGETIQLGVLACVRESICTLEEMGVGLDPVQYQAVVGVLVASAGALFEEIDQLATQLGRAKAEISRRRNQWQ